MEPVSRASAWRKGYSTPNELDDEYNYNCIGDHEEGYLWRDDVNGKCGICGDAWLPKPHKLEAPGTYSLYGEGILTGKYQKGQNITVKIKLVENNGGFFMFKLCQNDNIEKDPDQECFNRYRHHT